MPYVKKDDRDRINKSLDIEHLSGLIVTEGDLNYTITRLCHEFLKIKGEKYSVYNTVIGVLECAKLELYRRKVSLYEDKKIVENGDVE
jgi:hypothetical protein